MSPTGAAITLEALSTGLRQCQSESTNPVAVGLAGRCRPVTAGTSYRSPPDVSGRLGSQPRLRIPQGSDALGNCETPSAYEHTFDQSQLLVGDSNRTDLRDTRAASTNSTPVHASLGPDCPSCSWLSLHPTLRRKRLVPIEANVSRPQAAVPDCPNRNELGLAKGLPTNALAIAGRCSDGQTNKRLSRTYPLVGTRLRESRNVQSSPYTTAVERHVLLLLLRDCARR
jgi:hypothetical protein